MSIENRIQLQEQDMVRRAQGGRSTPAVTGGHGVGPMRRARQPAEPPDLRVLEDKCQVMVHRVDGLLQYAIEHPLTDATKIDFHPFQDVIPVIKLTRVFLNKLSRPTNNGPHPLSGMSPDDLSKIIRSTVRAPGKLEKFLHRMETDHASTGGIDTEKVFDILDCLQRPIKIIKFHLSQLEHSDSPQGSHPKYREWMRVWFANICRSGCRVANPGLGNVMSLGCNSDCSFT
ncbi:hypothetical protein PtA15_10A177 [Puccinia triticina]|uniref:NET domain-containing protein n=2 Tax=Puccinia triticina TaxID=208348 RepID=A0ABY7CV16_9BASI|nr:uncharacterized protein PtA15_10A177 [Puccinia triticina]WAQ88758.1 hypothetical protein PtA15_10A177 [Puccinia triticina]